MADAIAGMKKGLILGNKEDYLYRHYHQHDLNGDGLISPEEAKSIPDKDYLGLLNDLHHTEARPEENQHLDLVVDLSPQRMVGLMAAGFRSSRPLDRFVLTDYLGNKEDSGDPLSLASSLIQEALGGKYDTAMGTKVADGVLIDSGLDVFVWQKILDRMPDKYLAYVNDCQRLDYRQLYTGRLKQDQNQDGFLTIEEVSKELDLGEENAIAEIFFAAITKGEREIPPHTLLHYMPVVSRLALLATVLAKDADLAELPNEEIKKDPRFDSISQFLSSQLIYDPNSFIQTIGMALQFLSAPEQILTFRENLRKFLSEKALELFDQRIGVSTYVVRIQPNLPVPTPPAQNPFSVTGAVTINPSNIEEEVFRSQKPVLLVIGADWCPNCRESKSFLERIAREKNAFLRVATLDAESYPLLTMHLTRTNAPAIPQFFYIEGSKIKGTNTGFQEDKFNLWLQKLVKSQNI